MAEEKALAEIRERQAVLDVITRLFVSTDERDWKAVESCFARQTRFDMSSMGAGPEAVVPARQVVDSWETGLKPLQAIHHQTGNHRVEIRGDRATAFCYGIAYHYLPNPTGRDTRTFVGTYDFELVKLEGTWRITAMRFNLKFREGNASLETDARA